MKKIINAGLILTLGVLLFSSCTSTSYVAQAPVYQDPGPVTYQSFYDNLSPYGNWIDYPDYGHVWAPNVGAGFRPYATNGQWRYSNEGWAWQSNYNWGWAPFHYGRWLYDDNYGWLWVPGYDWSPAWVTWGSVDNYYAWAPLMPEVNVGVQYGSWRPHSSYWNMVPREHIYDRNVSNVIIHTDHNNNRNSNNNINSNNNNNNTTIVNNNNTTNNITKNITIINNYNTSRTNNYYAKGPDVNEVEKYTGNKIQPVAFKEVHQINKPAQSGNTMEVYRPVVQNPHPQPSAPSMPSNQNTSQNNYPVNNQNGNQGNFNNNANNNGKPETTPKELSTPMPVQNVRPQLNQTGNDPARPVNNNSNNNTPGSTPKDINNQHPQNQPATQNPPPVQNSQPQVQPPRVQNQQPGQNNQSQAQNQHAQNQPAAQNQPMPQPRVFRRVDASQTRPIRTESQTPVMQPRQQQRNVQQLPIQRAPVNQAPQPQPQQHREPVKQ